MKYSLFQPLGQDYPHSLETQYERILVKIVQLWETPEIDAYFSDLLIDKRGGRKGFPKNVLADIVRLAEYREYFTLKQAERKEDALKELKRRGIDFNPDSFLLAVETGDKNLLDLLLRAGINIHVKYGDGTPPLIMALKKGYTIVAQILLKAGVDVNVTDASGFTPLILACGKNIPGYKEIAETLIKKGAFVNMRDRLGYTPLLLALSGGTAEIAELLIERGADITAQTRKGETALSLARKANHSHLVRLLELKLEEREEARKGKSGNPG